MDQLKPEFPLGVWLLPLVLAAHIASLDLLHGDLLYLLVQSLIFRQKTLVLLFELIELLFDFSFILIGIGQASQRLVDFVAT
jgi:hypothetical protein